MIQEYYVVSGTSRKGPYDMVAIVRKIRNGTLSAGTYLQQNESDAPKPAQDWAELTEFFSEKKEDKPLAAETAHAHGKGLFATLRSGNYFFHNNHYSTVFSGLFVLAIILAGVAINVMLPPILHNAAYIIGFVLSYFLLACYMLTVLRMVRGQPVEGTYLRNRIIPALKPLFIASFFICIPAAVGLAILISGLPSGILLIGLLIFAVPGLFTFSIYAFAPLLILDRGNEVWESMEASRKAVMGKHMEKAGILYALFVINFLAGLCVLLPLALTLPITMGALAEMYDETFS